MLRCLSITSSVPDEFQLVEGPASVRPIQPKNIAFTIRDSYPNLHDYYVIHKTVYPFLGDFT